jgi:hypothetical protein
MYLLRALPPPSGWAGWSCRRSPAARSRCDPSRRRFRRSAGRTCGTIPRGGRQRFLGLWWVGAVWYHVRVHARVRACAQTGAGARASERSCVLLHVSPHPNYIAHLQSIGIDAFKNSDNPYISRLCWLHTLTTTYLPSSPLHMLLRAGVVCCICCCRDSAAAIHFLLPIPGARLVALLSAPRRRCLSRRCRRRRACGHSPPHAPLHLT